MLSHLPPFMAKTILPIKEDRLTDSNKACTVHSLMAYVYKQVKPIMRAGVDPGKLYLATQDGFFLPPFAVLKEVLNPAEHICLLTW